jgi:hypothetical protein
MCPSIHAVIVAALLAATAIVMTTTVAAVVELPSRKELAEGAAARDIDQVRLSRLRTDALRGAFL